MKKLNDDQKYWAMLALYFMKYDNEMALFFIRLAGLQIE